MRFAVNVPTSAGASEYSTLAFCDHIDWPIQRDYGRLVDELGFDGLAVPDHLMTGDGATTEAITTLAGLACATSDATIFPKTINNELRHGPLLAKTSATLDAISEGRLKLGMGAGWKADEALAYGYDWPSAPDRLRAMEETIELTERLWTEESVTYDGEYYHVENAVCTPNPVQDPHPPIAVGGGGEEFTLRIAAKHADEWNFWGPVETIEHKLDVLESHCETYGTPFEAIDVSWFTRCIVRKTEAKVEGILDEVPRFRDPDEDDPMSSYNNLIGTPAEIAAEIEAYREIGVDEVDMEFVDCPDRAGPELFIDEVVPEFR